MQLGMIGLGRMGGNMVRRLMRAGHDVRRLRRVARRPCAALAAEGAIGHLVTRRRSWRRSRRHARSGSWCRPRWWTPRSRHWRRCSQAGRHRRRRRQLALHRRHPPRRGAARRAASHYVDVGTSGGVWGLERGYCLMIGGDADGRARGSSRSSRRWRRAQAASRARPDATVRRGTAERGYLHCGPSGAGHFVKMVHNGIEYGLMAAYAEGLQRAAARRCRPGGASEGRRDHARSRHPEHYRYTFDLGGHHRGAGGAAAWWRRGCST